MDAVLINHKFFGNLYFSMWGRTFSTIVGMLSFEVSAGVHDSFWTHAADVEKMNQILRETFVELYKQPILEDVSVFVPLCNSEGGKIHPK
jgi:hypothetical protein